MSGTVGGGAAGGTAGGGAELAARFRASLLQLAAVLAAGVAVGLSLEGSARLGVLTGVGMVAVSGVVALLLKRRAAPRGLTAAMVALAWPFGLRGVLVAAGVVVLQRWQGAVPWFVGGFFLPYLVVQLIEVRFVLAGVAGPRAARSE